MWDTLIQAFITFSLVFGEWTLVGWEVGSQGGGMVVLKTRGDDGLDLGSGCGMQIHGWITNEYVEKGTGVGPCRPVTWAQLTLGL